VFSNLYKSDTKDYWKYNPVKAFAIDKISANFPDLSPEVKFSLLDSHFSYFHTYSIIGEDLTFGFPREIYVDNLNENFMISIKNFFFKYWSFLLYVEPSAERNVR